MPPVVRRGEPVCPGREAGRRASAAGPGMAHRRVPWDKRGNRGNTTQEGEQAGGAFLLVTFLWPRKEKSLAQARRAGETPSRATPSCPAWRSHAIHTWDDIAPGNEVTQPLTLTLSRKGRGDVYLGAMRCAYCTLRLSRWGKGTVTADDYASLIDLTRPYLSRGRRKPRRGWNPRTLPRRGMPGWHPPTTLPPLALATTMRR